MQYPADWTFVENLYEDRDYRPNDPTAYLGTFCPTASLEDVLGNTQCATEPVTVKISTYKLKEGTTSKEFHDNEISPRLDSEFLKANYARKNIETSDIKISGLPAIQRIDTSGGGKMDKILESIGGEGLPKSKFLGVYVANGNTGYEVAFDVRDEKDFERYLPTIQKMIDSIQIK